MPLDLSKLPLDGRTHFACCRLIRARYDGPPSKLKRLERSYGITFAQAEKAVHASDLIEDAEVVSPPQHNLETFPLSEQTRASAWKLVRLGEQLEYLEASTGLTLDQAREALRLDLDWHNANPCDFIRDGDIPF